MVKVENQTFPILVTLDGKWFHQCRFARCNMVYDGGPVRFTECSFERPRLILGGNASNTVSALKQMDFVITPPGLWDSATLQ